MPADHPDDTWLSNADLAARYHTDESTIRYWRHAGTGPKGTRIGRRTLYRLADVVAWEREREQAEPARRERESEQKKAARQARTA